MSELGLRQEDLCVPLGVATRGAVGHYLNRRREPSLAQMNALAGILGMDMEALFGTKQPPSEVRETRPTYFDPQREALNDMWDRLSLEHRKTLQTLGDALAQQAIEKVRKRTK